MGCPLAATSPGRNISDLSDQPKKLSDIFLHAQKGLIRCVYKCTVSFSVSGPGLIQICARSGLASWLAGIALFPGLGVAAELSPNDVCSVGWALSSPTIRQRGLSHRKQCLPCGILTCLPHWYRGDLKPEVLISLCKDRDD